MNFAFLIRSKAALALHAWASDLAAAHCPAPLEPRSPVTTGIRLIECTPGTTHNTRTTARTTARPLRVLRVVENGTARTSGTERMVISGRMADVCAELDRMAAREAAEGTSFNRSRTSAC